MLENRINMKCDFSTFYTYFDTKQKTKLGNTAAEVKKTYDEVSETISN